MGRLWRRVGHRRRAQTILAYRRALEHMPTQVYTELNLDPAKAATRLNRFRQGS